RVVSFYSHHVALPAKSEFPMFLLSSGDCEGRERIIREKFHPYLVRCHSRMSAQLEYIEQQIGEDIAPATELIRLVCWSRCSGPMKNKPTEIAPATTTT